jgi:hypothetical protein
MFNALKFSKELEEAGFSREQAEATVNIFYKFMEHNFATKEYIGHSLDGIRSEITDVRQELKSEMSELRQELKSEISGLRSGVKSEISELRYGLQSLEYKMTIKLGSLLIGGLTIIGTLMKLWLPH